MLVPSLKATGRSTTFTHKAEPTQFDVGIRPTSPPMMGDFGRVESILRVMLLRRFGFRVFEYPATDSKKIRPGVI